MPYQDIKPFPDAPPIIGCYLTTIVVAMTSPLWHKLIAPASTPSSKSANWRGKQMPVAVFGR